MRIPFAILFCLLWSAITSAQEYPRGEVFLGYSYLNADLNDLTTRQNANGADFSFVANFNQWVGAETNFSGYYKSINIEQDAKLSVRDFALLFGPRFHYKLAFAHALFGLDDLGGSAFGFSTTDGAFAGALGGGALFKVSRHLGLEGSADYVFSRHNIFGGSAVTQNNFRVNAGIVFTFGHTGEAVARPTAQAGAPMRPTPGSGVQIPGLGLRVVPDSVGPRVTEIGPNSPAEIAGLHVGDVINSIDGSQINTPTEFAAEVSRKTPGSTIRIGYLIRGQWQSEKVVTLERK